MLFIEVKVFINLPMSVALFRKVHRNIDGILLETDFIKIKFSSSNNEPYFVIVKHIIFRFVKILILKNNNKFK